MLRAVTPALVDDGGRRRNRGSSFTALREEQVRTISVSGGRRVRLCRSAVILELLADALGRFGGRKRQARRVSADVLKISGIIVSIC